MTKHPLGDECPLDGRERLRERLSDAEASGEDMTLDTVSRFEDFLVPVGGSRACAVAFDDSQHGTFAVGLYR